MNIEKIGPLPPEKGKQKTSEKSEPDSEAFKEMMKIGQTLEVDLDEQSARKYSQPLEEEKEPEPTPPSSSDIYYYKKQSEKSSEEHEVDISKSVEKSKNTPRSPEFYSELEKKKLPPDLKKMEYLVAKELKTEKKAQGILLPKKEKTIPQAAPLLKTTKPKSEEKIIGKDIPLSEQGQKIKEAELHARHSKAEKAQQTKKEEEVKQLKKESKPSEKKEKKLEEKKQTPKKETKIPSKKEEISTPTLQTLIVSDITQTQAHDIASRLTSNLNPEIVPVIEHMIGAIIQFANKGVSETQIILNNQKFENSRFYNSKIIFEKYSTAPHSYNIRLTGSQEAVSIFSENIEGLYKKLSQADLDFEIGQLSAEYDRPLFKRRTPVGEFDRDTKSR